MRPVDEIRSVELSSSDMSRYSRHILIPEIGVLGQKRLKTAKVLIAGVGGLGSPIALYLAAAGVGHLGIADYDAVDGSNLQRQIIHAAKDVGRLKTESAEEKIKNINPQVSVTVYNRKLDSSNALEIIKNYDVVADGLDSFPARYLLNDACVIAGTPLVYGAVFRFEGQASVFYPKQRGSACYRCLFPEPPQAGLVPSCGEGGVVGVLPGIIGSIQAAEVIKLIVGGNYPLINRLLLLDAWSMKFRELKLEKNPLCPMCGENPSIHELVDYEEFCGFKKTVEETVSITAAELKQRIDKGDSLQIIDIREPYEQSVFKFHKSINIPFEQLVQRKGEINEKIDAVFICKAGRRSIYAMQALKEAGYKGKMLNLKGGTNMWAIDIDSSFVRY